MTMAPIEFNIVSHWRVRGGRVRGGVDQVYDLISKPEDFVRWWPAVYLRVQDVEPGDDDGVGRVVDLHTKGLLPYTLDWRAKVLEVDKPHHLVVEARGDLEGRGEWQLRQDGDWVQVDYDWTVIANKPWMKLLAPLLRPVFAANHRWAMKQGQLGLVRELTRPEKDSQERPTGT
jgi:hypothetical protein